MYPISLFQFVAFCFLATGTFSSCTRFRSSEQINEIGAIHYILGKPEENCVWQIGGQYYLKCPKIPYKRHPHLFGFIADGYYSPSSYTRIQDDSLLSYEYILIGPHRTLSEQIENQTRSTPSLSPQSTLDAFCDTSHSFSLQYDKLYTYIPTPFDLKHSKKHKVLFPSPNKKYNIFSEGSYEFEKRGGYGNYGNITWVNPPNYFKNNDQSYEVPVPDSRSTPQKTLSILDKILIDFPTSIVLTPAGWLYLLGCEIYHGHP